VFVTGDEAGPVEAVNYCAQVEHTQCVVCIEFVLYIGRQLLCKAPPPPPHLSQHACLQRGLASEPACSGRAHRECLLFRNL
jgi:hypothetical protein